MHKPTHIQISIPTPCHEDWNKMPPSEQGRFCDSCKKCVIDFTNYTDAQLYTYIAARKGQEICGRLNTTQLNSTLHIPRQPHSRLYRYFIGLGLTLILAQIPTEELRAKTPYVYNAVFNNYEAEPPATDSIRIRGQVLDKAEPIIGAIIELSYNGAMVAGAVTDEEGMFSVNVSAYNILVMKIKAPSYKTQEVLLNAAKMSVFQKIQLRVNEGCSMGLIIIQYKVPLIDFTEPNKTIITSDDIEKMAH